MPGVLRRARGDFAAGSGVSAVPVIAIDGPSASGKGTVAQRVAATLGFHHLDSGALYRLVALAGARGGGAPGGEATPPAHPAPPPPPPPREGSFPPARAPAPPPPHP